MLTKQWKVIWPGPEGKLKDNQDDEHMKTRVAFGIQVAFFLGASVNVTG